MKISKQKKGFSRYVISDIHGCYDTFISLLKKINLQKDDQLFLLGDYIDRGKHSDKVLDYIIKLKDSNYNVFPLRGNHEENTLNAFAEYDKASFMFFVGKINNSKALLDKKGSLKKKYFNFMNTLPYYYKLDNFYLVHAGFNFKAKKPLKDFTAMLELRKQHNNSDLFNGKRTIFGHKVHYLDEIKKAIKSKSANIPLDNGCVYTQKHKVYDVSRTGNLCCLNLDTMKLIVQKNVE